MPEYRGEKLKDVEVKSDIFDGLTFSTLAYYKIDDEIAHAHQWWLRIQKTEMVKQKNRIWLNCWCQVYHCYRRSQKLTAYRIRSSGGKIVQIAKGLDPILIVYGGTTIRTPSIYNFQFFFHCSLSLF